MRVIKTLKNLKYIQRDKISEIKETLVHVDKYVIKLSDSEDDCQAVQQEDISISNKSGEEEP